MQINTPQTDLDPTTENGTHPETPTGHGFDPTAAIASTNAVEQPAPNGVEPGDGAVATAADPPAEREVDVPLEPAVAPVAGEQTQVAAESGTPAEPATAPPAVATETPPPSGPPAAPQLQDVPAFQWGYVDDEGNLWQRDGELHTGRVVGRITGANPAIAFGFYGQQFDQFVRRVDALATEIDEAANKAAFLPRVRRLQEQAPAVEGLGDFDGLIRRLQRIELGITGEMDARRAHKDRLAARAEALQDATDWKATGDELGALFEEWKTIGTLGRDEEQALWDRFNTARQAFYDRRKAHFAQRDRERGENQAKKEDLCVRAEALRDSTDWKATGNALKALQAEWKAVGSAGREQDQLLWTRFRGAMDVFFANRAARFDDNRRAKETLIAAAEAVAGSNDWAAAASTLKGLQEQWKQVGFAGGDQDDVLWSRFRRALDAFYNRRSETFAERDRAHADNLRLKEALVDEAESLLDSDDLRAAIQRVKAMQEEWKAIGPVPRERADEIWKRFRSACDGVFDRSREQWERRQTVARTNLKDSLERQRTVARELMESIARDDELLDRWQDQLANLKPGGREPEIRRDLETKIAGLKGRIEGKQTRIEELLASIAETGARLTADASR